MKLVIGNRTYSSWSLRGWLAMRACGLDFEEVFLALRTEDFRVRISDYSPTAQVPCLVDGDNAIPDSLAIIDYLDKKVPGAHFWPEDLTAYGQARALAAEMHSGFRPLRSHCPMNLSVTVEGFKPDTDVEQDIDTIVNRWNKARATYGAGGPFLFGAWSAADMMYAPVVTRFVTYDLTQDKGAHAYMDAVLAHPHMIEWTDGAKREAATSAYDDLPPGALVDGFTA